MLGYGYDSRILEGEKEELLRIWGCSEVDSDFKASLWYNIKLSQKKNESIWEGGMTPQVKTLSMLV